MTTSVLDDENVYVKELNRLFLSCTKNGDTHLDASGLQDLLVKLNLSSFADVVLERMLRGCTVVDFTTFKERFIHLLPDIINVTTVAGDLESNAGKSLPELGIERQGFLTRYEAHILCGHVPELNSLGVNEINEIFDQVGTSGNGRITSAQFLAQYNMQNRSNEERDFVNEAFVPLVNLFEALDPSNTGVIRCHELLEHWRACGISTEQGLYVLKLFGQSLEGTVDAIALSGSLERQLNNLVCSPTASTIVRVALLSLHAFVDHTRCSLKEAELRAEHFYKQFQQANQRHILLIDELEHNQLSIEQAYERRFRSFDERYRTKLSQMEERFSLEKKDLLAELEKAEEELSRFRKNESSHRARLQLLERQCTRIGEEAKGLSETMQQLEQVNRHLRSELNRALQRRPMEEMQPMMMLRHGVDLLITHNKRLRGRIQELTGNRKTRCGRFNTIEPLYAKWTDAFRIEMLALKRRQENRRFDTLSEIESELESIFKSRKRRLLKVKERKRRHDRIVGIVENSSTNEWVENVKEENEKISDVGFSKKLEQFLRTSQDSMIERIKEQHRKEIVALKRSANKTLADALTDQQRQITESFEKERRQFQIKMATERNTLERRFAEEKMKMIDRLQEDFECELNRLKTVMSPSVFDDSRLLASGFGDSDVCESIKNIRTCASVAQPNVKLPKSCILMEDMRKNGDSYDLFNHSDDINVLNTEKISPPVKTFPKNIRKTYCKCSHYETIRTKLRQIHIAVAGESNVESGFEDVISGADSVAEEHTHLKNEIKKLNDRLSLVREKIIELLVYLARCSSRCMENFESWEIGQTLDDCLTTGNTWILQETACDMGSISKKEQLEAENALLNARLAESAELVKMLVREYSGQLNRTSRLGKFIRSLYSFDGE